MFLFENVPEWIKEVPDQYKMQEMCEKAVCMEPHCLAFVADFLKTEGVCVECAMMLLK